MHKMIDGQRFSRWFYGFASGVGDIGVLPVHLVQFNGEVHSDGNRLMWLTATERNSAYFLVERSSDGLEFLPVGSVAAAGESAQPVAYELWDMTPPDGLSYYRLRMVDRTGHEEFSSTIPLRRDTKSLVIFPVPVEDVINWSVPLEHATHVVVRDALGRTVIDMQASSNSLQGPRVAALATGTYTIQLLDDRDHIVGRSRFVKR
jgi:hypothetical protein